MFPHGQIAIGPEKYGSRFDDMHGRFERSLFPHGKIAIGIEKGGSRLDDTHIVESGRAYRRGEKRILQFQWQSSHEKTTIVHSDCARRKEISQVSSARTVLASHGPILVGKCVDSVLN